MSTADLQAAFDALVMYQQDVTMPRSYRDYAEVIARQLDKILHPAPNEQYMPVQGDTVHNWLRAWRDKAPIGPQREAVDVLVDDFRMRAQRGLNLIDNLPVTP